MTLNRISFICIICMIFAASCAKSSGVFVLLPGPDGKTGELQVNSKGGSQILRQPYESVAMQSGQAAPPLPTPMNKAEIKDNFGQALSALPSPPLHFRLFFKAHSAALTSESRKSLRKILPSVVSRKSCDVTIVGHSDRVGTRLYNYSLGLERARMAAKLLIRGGIDPASVSIFSRGKDEPLTKTAKKTADSWNRRVEITVR